MDVREHSAGRLLLIACGVSCICFLGSYMRIPVVPLFAVSLGADTAQVGWINSAFMFTAGALSLPAGLISDRFGRRLPLLGGLLLLAGSSFLLYWCHTLPQMAGVYLLFGIGLATFPPALMSYVADVTPPPVLGQAFGWYTMAVYAGMTFGPAAGGLLATALGLRPVFLVAAALTLLAFCLALWLLPAKASAAPHNLPRPTVGPALRQLLRNRPFLACLAASAGGSFGFGMFVTFMPLYIRDLGMSTGHVGMVFAAQALTNALSRLPSGRLGDRIADRGVLAAGGLAAFALALAGFALCRTSGTLLGMAAAMGGSMGIMFSAVSTLIVEVVPRELRGLAMGCYNTSIYAGMLLCAATMGTVIHAAGFQVGFLCSGVVGLAMLALFLPLARRRTISA